MTDGLTLKRMIDGVKAPNEYVWDTSDQRIPNLLSRLEELECRIAALEAELKPSAAGIAPRPDEAPQTYARLSEIASCVSTMTGVSIGDLRSDRRGYYLSKTRHVLMYLACKHTKLSTMRIGVFLRKDHTSVMYGRNRIARLLEQEPELKSLVDGISASLKP